MHIINIFMKQNAVPCTIGFKSEKDAEKEKSRITMAWQKYIETKKDSIVVVHNGYGHSFDVPLSHIDCVMLFNMTENFEFEYDKAICKARFDEMWLKRRSGDMELMRLFPAQQHPGMVMPGGRA